MDGKFRSFLRVDFGDWRALVYHEHCRVRERK